MVSWRLGHRRLLPATARRRGLGLWLCALLAPWLAAPGAAQAHDGASASATVRDYYFEVIAPEEPLAQNLVTALAQSPDGFLWIGTQGGLHRFDGYRFVLHDHDPEDPGSLADGFVSAIGIDADGRLVVGGGRGSVQRLGLDGTRFEPVVDPSTWGARGHVGGLVATEDGALWIASAGGVERMGPDGDVLMRLADPGHGFDLMAPRAVIPASVDGVYAATSDGIARIDGAGAPAETIARGLPRVLSLLRSGSGTLWAGTVEGLHRIDAGGRTTRVWPPAHETPSGKLVQGIAEAPDGRLWLAVFGRGLAIVDPATGAVERLRHDRSIAGSLPEDGVRHLFLGKSGLLWIGGESRGLVRADPSGARFTLVTDENPERPYVAANNVRSLWEAPDGALWIGTDGDGLKRVDAATRRITYHTDALLAALPDGASNSDLRINAIVPMPDGRLWLPSNRGVLEFEPSSGTARLAWPDARGPAPRDPHARAVLPGGDGSVWLATWADGLVRFQPGDGSQHAWRHDPARGDSLSHDTVLTLHRDRGGLLWIGTLGGLDRLDPRTGVVTRMPRAGSSARAPAGDVVRAVLEGADGALWFASHGGLSRLADGERERPVPAFERWTPGTACRPTSSTPCCRAARTGCGCRPTGACCAWTSRAAGSSASMTTTVCRASSSMAAPPWRWRTVASPSAASAGSTCSIPPPSGRRPSRPSWR